VAAETATPVHAFLVRLRSDWQKRVSEHAQPFTRNPGSYLAREGEAAEKFYLISNGHVAIEIRHPLRGPLTVQTVGPGEVVGWSWILPPYRWQFDARTQTEVTGLEIDAGWLRGVLEAEPELGFHFCKELLGVVSSRLAATRIRCLDLYQ
jgi:CRP-like cAMP-binding protein